MIRFGTSGWRAVIGEGFTFGNVRIAVQAIAGHLLGSDPNSVRGLTPAVQSARTAKEGQNKSIVKCDPLGVVVGYDTRFLAEEFARSAVEVLAANGIRSFLTGRDVPTPVVAHEILKRKTAGGINFTASHNPAEYHGLKFSPESGGPALPDTTQDLEQRCRVIAGAGEPIRVPFTEARRRRLVTMIDPRPAYLKSAMRFLDVNALRKARLKVVVDTRFGTGRGYLDALLTWAGCRVTLLNHRRDVLFGGHHPEPNEANLREAVGIMRKERAHLVLGTDGDADRFGVVDREGTFLPPNLVLAILLDHLAGRRGWRGVAARSVMTTHLLDAVAAQYGISVRETPVGFKYIAEVMANERMVIGGEESGGLTVLGHVPEKDGILACLLMAEVAAVEGRPLTRVLDDLMNRVGRIATGRADTRLPQERMAAVRERLEAHPPTEIAGLKVERTVRLDGFKFVLDGGSWVGYRLSGTEPVVRCYLESRGGVSLNRLRAEGLKLIGR